MKYRLFTIGHSNHEIAAFIELLRMNEIEAIGDVRSNPGSRYSPQFSQNNLAGALHEADIKYAFLGKQLGGRSPNPACYKGGQVDYTLMAKEPAFVDGINHAIAECENYRIALMCSEKDPIECHRFLLVSRQLAKLGQSIGHILSDGTVEDHVAAESRLLEVCKLPERDLFRERDDFLAEAYLKQAQRVAYRNDMADNYD